MFAENLPIINLGFGPTDGDLESIEAFDVDEGVIVNCSKILDGKLTDRSAVTCSLKSMRRSRQYEQIVFEWPSLDEAALRMASWFTPILPSSSGVPLLNFCLDRAMEGYRYATSVPPRVHDDPYLRLRAFILVASQHFHEALAHSLYGRTEDGWVKWKPFDEPIHAWIVNNYYQHVLVLPTDTQPTLAEQIAARNKMMYEVFEFNDLSLAGIVSADQNLFN